MNFRVRTVTLEDIVQRNTTEGLLCRSLEEWHAFPPPTVHRSSLTRTQKRFQRHTNSDRTSLRISTLGGIYNQSNHCTNLYSLYNDISSSNFQFSISRKQARIKQAYCVSVTLLALQEQVHHGHAYLPHTRSKTCRLPPHRPAVMVVQ